MKSQKNSYINTTPAIVLSIMLLVALLMPFKSTSATEVSRCKIVQQNLSGHIRSNDLRTRVNRMQAYQYMHQKLDIFVQRLENNNQPGAGDLRRQSDELGKKIDKFRADYETYDINREKLSKLDNCSKNSVSFDRALQTVRNSRATVHQDVIELDEKLNSSVQASVRDLYTDLLASSPTGVSNE